MIKWLYTVVKYTFYLFLLVITSAFLAAVIDINWTDKKNIKNYQEIYKIAYISNMCLAMEIWIDRYQESPFTNNWSYHGYSTREKVEEMIKGSAKRMLKRTAYAFNIPKSFQPDPDEYSLEDASDKCKFTYEKFQIIPFH